jgi:hypothetical protein
VKVRPEVEVQEDGSAVVRGLSKRVTRLLQLGLAAERAERRRVERRREQRRSRRRNRGSK